MKKQKNEKQQNLYFLLKTLCKNTFFLEKNYFSKMTFFNKKIIKMKILFEKT